MPRLLPEGLPPLLDVGTSEEDDSDFETQPLESTSSSCESDEDGTPQHFGLEARHRKPCDRQPSTSDESELSREVPDWFQDAPFLYSGRMSVLAAPGAILAFLFSGELVLVLVTVGMLIVYLLYHAGSKQKAMVAYLFMFIAIQLLVVYSVLPMLWKSLFNVIIILALNMYTFLTGGWIMLTFDELRFKDIDLLVLIETGLFSLYPIVFIVLVTWSIAALTSITVAPYVFMLLGFVVLQVFLAPTTSSFIKPHPQGNLAVWDVQGGYILDPVAVAIIAMAYTLTSPTLVIILKAVTGWKSFLLFGTWVQVIFISAVSVFLATFLNLRLFLEMRGVQQNYLQIVRWSSLLFSLLLVAPFLDSLVIDSFLLLWIPVVVGIYIFILLSTLWKNKGLLRWSMVALVATSLVIFCQLPWQLEYNVGIISISSMQMLLLLNFFLSTAAIYSAICWSNDALGIFLLLQSICHSFCIKQLLSENILSPVYLPLSAILFSYLAIRLFLAGKLNWQHSLLVSSLHLTTVSSCIGFVFSELALDGLLSKLSDFISNMILFSVLLKIIVYEQQTNMSPSEIHRYGLPVTAALLLNSPNLLSNILYIFASVQHSTVFSAQLGLICLIECLLYLKLAIFNGSVFTRRSKCLVFTLVLISLLLLVLRPELSLKSDELRRWCVIVGIFCLIAAVMTASLYKNSLHIVGSAFGLPFGFCCLNLVFPGHPSLLAQLMFGLLAMLCVMLALIAWQSPKRTERWVKAIAIMIGVTSFALYVLEATLLETRKPMTALLSSDAAILLVAVIIRNSKFDADLSELDVKRKEYSLSLSLISNVYTFAAFLLYIVCCPVHLKYLWICFGSSSLCLIAKDDLLIKFDMSGSKRYVLSIVAITLTLYSATLMDAILFNYSGILYTIVGVFELLTLTLTIPVPLNLWSVLWRETYWLSDRLVVFLAPLYLLLFFTGQTYSSWILATLGVAVGAWLMKYKLPLVVYR